MRRFDVYGFWSPSIDDAANIIETELAVDLLRRDSEYRGTYFFAGEGSKTELLLQRNCVGSRWHLEFPQYGSILMVNERSEMDLIKKQLTSNHADLICTIQQVDDPHDEIHQHEDGSRHKHADNG